MFPLFFLQHFNTYFILHTEKHLHTLPFSSKHPSLFFLLVISDLICVEDSMRMINVIGVPQVMRRTLQGRSFLWSLLWIFFFMSSHKTIFYVQFFLPLSIQNYTFSFYLWDFFEEIMSKANLFHLSTTPIKFYICKAKNVWNQYSHTIAPNFFISGWSFDYFYKIYI